MILAVDTSARRRATVVLADTGGTLLQTAAVATTGVEAVATALAELWSEAITAVAVTTGPGSYTGTRAGMASALGIAQAAGRPLFGIPSLLVAALGASSPGPVTALADASRGGVYQQRFRPAGDSLAADGPAERVAVDGLVLTGRTVSCDVLGIEGVEPADAAVGLARAAAVACGGAELPRAGLTALYLNQPRFVELPARG